MLINYRVGVVNPKISYQYDYCSVPYFYLYVSRNFKWNALNLSRKDLICSTGGKIVILQRKRGYINRWKNCNGA